MWRAQLTVSVAVPCFARSLCPSPTDKKEDPKKYVVVDYKEESHDKKYGRHLLNKKCE